MKKVSLILALLLVTSLFASCASNGVNSTATTPPSQAQTATPQSSAPSEEADANSFKLTYPIAGDNLTLSLAANENANVAVVSSWEDTPFVKAYEEATGVKLEVTHPTDFSLLFASASLPDILWYTWTMSYPGGPVQAINDGIIIPINDYVEEYAPDYYAMLKSKDIYMKQATTSDGLLYGFNYIRKADILCVSAGLIIRSDWLNELGMEAPRTPDELRETLITFRDEKGATAPWSCTYYNMLNRGITDGVLTSPFGLIKGDFYQKDGTVHYGFYSQELKEVLEWLNGLYSEGLLDSSLATVDNNTAKSNIMNGISGLNFGSAGSDVGVYLETMAQSNPDFDVAGIASLVKERGDQPYSGHYDNPVLANVSAISGKSEKVELAMQFLNYAWTEEGNLLCNYGTEDVSYTYVDGKPAFTDLLVSNPDGLTLLQAMVQYSNAGSHTGITFGQEENYIWQYMRRKQQTDALMAWSDADSATYKMPSLTMAESDSAEYSKISSEVSTFISESLIKFINGTKPLSEYDDYMSTLKKMGVERMIEMHQDALNLYNSK